MSGHGHDDDNNDAHEKYRGRTNKGQFQKGHCGNPKGRPRQARSTRAIFQQMLASKVAMTIDGKVRMLTVTEAMAARVKREALAGPLRGLERGVAVAQLYSLDDAPDKQTVADLSILTDKELDDYGRIAAKLLGEEFDTTTGANKARDQSK
jgi:hypothetical protein